MIMYNKNSKSYHIKGKTVCYLIKSRKDQITGESSIVDSLTSFEKIHSGGGGGIVEAFGGKRYAPSA